MNVLVDRGALAVAVVGLVACGAEDPLAALAAARSGEIIILPAGHYAGPLRVPAGVTLRAAPGAEVLIEADGAHPALIVETGDAGPATRLVGLAVRSSGTAAVLGRGGGALAVEQLALDLRKGLGLAAEGLRSVVVRSTTIRGSVTPQRAGELAFPVKPDVAPPIGLALSQVQDFVLEDVSLAGLGGFGAVLVGSKGRWTRGAVADSVGVGIMQDGGELTLEEVTVQRIVPGQRGAALLAYAIVVAGGAVLESRSVQVADNQGHGIVQDGSSAQHTDLRVRANQSVGVWLQSSAPGAAAPRLAIDGAASELQGNRGGGIFALAPGRIDVRGARIAGTLEKSFPIGETGVAAMADGIQLSSPQDEVVLQDVTLADNARVGLLLSGELPSASAVTLGAVQITGAGSYGLIVQQGAPVGQSWQVQRDAALAQADADFSGQLDIAAALGVVPSVELIRTRNLLGEDGLLGPEGAVHSRYQVGQRGLTPEND